MKKDALLINEDQRVVLKTLQDLLRLIGDANDAEDHGFPDVAAQERTDARTGIRELMAQHAFLADLLPTLPEELDSPRLLTFSWAEIYDRIEVFAHSH